MTGRFTRRRCRAGFAPDQRASVSVELALVTTFFLVPLLLLGLDFLFVMLGRQQMAESTHALFMLAWSSPVSATDLPSLDAVLAQANQHGVGTISFAATPTETIACLQPDGSDGASSAGSCSTGIAETFVTYQLAARIALPVGIGLIPDPFMISASSTVRIR